MYSYIGRFFTFNFESTPSINTTIKIFSVIAFIIFIQTQNIFNITPSIIQPLSGGGVGFFRARSGWVE